MYPAPVRDCFEQVTRKFPSASSNLGTKRLSATGAAGGCAGAKRMEPIFQRHGCGLSQKGWPRSENFGISGISERNSTLGLKMDHRTWSSIFRQLQLCLFNDHFVILSFPGRTLLLRGIFSGKNLYKIESSISLHPYISLHHIASIFVCNVETK